MLSPALVPNSKAGTYGVHIGTVKLPMCDIKCAY